MNRLEERLLERFVRFEGILHRRQGMQMRERGMFGSPHRGQGRVMAVLKMQPEISQKELGYLLDMRNQSLGELLGKLEQKEYITRTPSMEDKRTAVIRLTDAGKETAAGMEDQKEESKDMFGVLNDDEKEMMLVFLDRLIEDLGDDETEGKGFGRRGDMRFGRGMQGDFCGGQRGRHPFGAGDYDEHR